jgi:hypothetical protein
MRKYDRCQYIDDYGVQCDVKLDGRTTGKEYCKKHADSRWHDSNIIRKAIEEYLSKYKKRLADAERTYWNWILINIACIATFVAICFLILWILGCISSTLFFIFYYIVKKRTKEQWIQEHHSDIRFNPEQDVIDGEEHYVNWMIAHVTLARWERWLEKHPKETPEIQRSAKI